MNSCKKIKGELESRILRRHQQPEYAKQIAYIEQSAFSDPWSLKSIEDTLRQNHYLNLGVWKEGKLLGYLFFSHVLDEGEIVRIAVDVSLRRQGAATMLFQELEKFCIENQISKIMLDVRAGNIPAVSFYKAMAFEEDGIRKNFYTNPLEDAILMSRKIG